MYPEDLLYTDDHEWLKKLEGNEALVGINHYAQDQMGDLVFIELPQEDEEFGAGESFAVMESVKAVADIYMPASGTILEVNENLLDAPEIINEDPYEEGWIVRIELTDESELDDLMEIDEYKEHLE